MCGQGLCSQHWELCLQSSVSCTAGHGAMGNHRVQGAGRVPCPGQCILCVPWSCSPHCPWGVTQSGTSQSGRVHLWALFSQLSFGVWGCSSPKHFLSPDFLLFSSDPTFGKRNFEPMLTVELCGTAGRTGFEFSSFAKISSRRGLIYPQFSLEASVPAYPAKGAPSSPSLCRHRRLPMPCHIHAP